MNIIQARELAMQGKTVISPKGKEWNEETFNDELYWHPSHVFGEWREKREPRRHYWVERDGVIDSFFDKREDAEASIKSRGERKSERIVTLIEEV